jgi:hypothetical protein
MRGEGHDRGDVFLSIVYSERIKAERIKAERVTAQRIHGRPRLIGGREEIGGLGEVVVDGRLPPNVDGSDVGGCRGRPGLKVCDWGGRRRWRWRWRAESAQALPTPFRAYGVETAAIRAPNRAGSGAGPLPARLDAH